MTIMASHSNKSLALQDFFQAKRDFVFLTISRLFRGHTDISNSEGVP